MKNFIKHLAAENNTRPGKGIFFTRSKDTTLKWGLSAVDWVTPQKNKDYNHRRQQKKKKSLRRQGTITMATERKCKSQAVSFEENIATTDQ